jgi:hypothetical protein
MLEKGCMMGKFALPTEHRLNIKQLNIMNECQVTECRKYQLQYQRTLKTQHQSYPRSIATQR